MNLLRNTFGLNGIFGRSIRECLKKPSASILSVYDTVISRQGSTLKQLHKTGIIKKQRKSKNPLGLGIPFMRGIVLRTLVKKPKKPNSANRKCVLLRLTNGKEMTAYIPGEGNNLQEHHTVLVRPGRTKDVPGLKLKCVRGKYDLTHVIKKVQ